MPTIMLVGEDEQLQQTRAAVLRTVGACITITNSAAAVFAIQTDYVCDLLLLCHSVPEKVAEAIAKAFRARYATKPILRITALRSWDSSPTDGIDAITSAEPDRLVKRTAELLGIRNPQRRIA